MEIERKYLIQCTAEAKNAIHAHCEDLWFIEQGYLSTATPEVRVRIKWNKAVAHAELTAKGDGDLTRSEVNVEIAFIEGQDLMRMCERTISKARCISGDWELDIFLDRDLILAEIELVSEEEEVTIPDWLAPFVEKEVTMDKSFKNKNLALPRGHLLDKLMGR